VDEHPVTQAWQDGDDTEPRRPGFWVDENDNLHPKPYKVKEMRWEAVRDYVLFPLLKIAAFILALIILGALTPDGIVPFNMD